MNSQDLNNKILQVQPELRRYVNETLQSDEKILEAGRFDMPFFHTPGGKVLIKTIPVIICYLIYIYFNYPFSVLQDWFISLFTTPRSIICLTVLILLPVYWRNLLRVLIVTDRRIIFFIKIPWKDRPKSESFSFDEVTDIKNKKFIGVQHAKIKLKAGKRKTEIDISEVSNLSNVVELIEQKKKLLLEKGPEDKTEKLEDKDRK